MLFSIDDGDWSEAARDAHMASEAEGHAPGAYPVHYASIGSHTIADPQTHVKLRRADSSPPAFDAHTVHILVADTAEAVLRLASNTLYLVATQCVGLTPDACRLDADWDRLLVENMAG